MWFTKCEKEKKFSPLKDAAAQLISGFVISAGKCLVAGLQKVEMRCTLRQKKVLLLAFCLAAGNCCGYLLCSGLFGKTGTAVIRYEPIPPVAQPPPFYRDSSGQGQRDTTGNQLFKNNK